MFDVPKIIKTAIVSANNAPTGKEYNTELKICSLFQQYRINAAIAQAIDQTVNNMNSPKRNPPENIGINIPNIACKA